MTGLTSKQVQIALSKYGPNDVPEKNNGFLKKFLLPLVSPISLMLLGAAILSYINQRTFDFYFILVLYFVNYLVQKWQEFKADKAIKHLKSRLSFNVMTLRDNKWRWVNVKNLVPEDKVKVTLGSIIPADGKVIESNNLTINEAVLTGESLPKNKQIRDKVFSGSFISTGDLIMEVQATGKNTFFGKTIFSIEEPDKKTYWKKISYLLVNF